MIEKWQTRFHLKLAAAVEIDVDGDLGFPGIAFYTGLSVLRTSRC
jgi:hypothetical protein